MVLAQKRVVCSLQVGGEVLPQVEQFRYLGVLFMSEGKMEGETDRGIDAAAAAMQPVYQTVMVNREHSHKVKLRLGCCPCDTVLVKA